jgi:hypothetical protein
MKEKQEQESRGASIGYHRIPNLKSLGCLLRARLKNQEKNKRPKRRDCWMICIPSPLKAAAG